MLSSFSARHLRQGDKISVQTLTGKHAGVVSTIPVQTWGTRLEVGLMLDCSECSSRHGLELPAHRLIAAERTP